MNESSVHGVEIAQFVADARRQAEYEIERFPNDDWPPIVLALLAQLERAEAMHAEAFRIGIAKQDQIARVEALADRWAKDHGPVVGRCRERLLDALRVTAPPDPTGTNGMRLPPV